MLKEGVVAVDNARVVLIMVEVISSNSELISAAFFRASLALNSAKRLSSLFSSISQIAGQTDNKYRITEGHILVK